MAASASKMKKFKITYYILYGLVVVVLLYMASDVLGVMTTIRDWGWFKFYLSELPGLVSGFLYFLGFFMVLSVGIENYFTYQKRKERKDLELEVTRLKAKLYDKEEELKGLHTTNVVEEPAVSDSLTEVVAPDDDQPENDEKSNEEGDRIN